LLSASTPRAALRTAGEYTPWIKNSPHTAQRYPALKPNQMLQTNSKQSQNLAAKGLSLTPHIIPKAFACPSTDRPQPQNKTNFTASDQQHLFRHLRVSSQPQSQTEREQGKSRTGNVVKVSTVKEDINHSGPYCTHRT